MAPKTARRGVLITASARKLPTRGAWRDEPLAGGVSDDEASEAASADEEAPEGRQARESQLEWERISREVREEQRQKHAETHFASGQRDGEALAGYDDVASDHEDSAPPPRPAEPEGAIEGAAPLSPARGAVASAALTGPTPAGEAQADGDGSLPPEGAVTAGKSGRGEKQRGGLKTGGERKRRAREAKEKEEEDSGKWLKVRLDGEGKAKRIKAARVVQYFDHDAGAHLAAGSTSAGATTAASSAAGVVEQASNVDAVSAVAAQGNFRSQVSLDMWGDDSEEE